MPASLSSGFSSHPSRPTPHRNPLTPCRSDPVVADQPYITAEVIKALNEPGPFFMLGTMDDGDVRAYTYALDHPANVKVRGCQ